MCQSNYNKKTREYKHLTYSEKTMIERWYNKDKKNSKEISLPLIVRTRRFGDKIVVKGMQGTKKVKDIFIDNKIDIAKRDIWPVVVDSLGHIVWIPRLKKSKFDKKSNEKYDIIMKYS